MKIALIAVSGVRSKFAVPAWGKALLRGLAGRGVRGFTETDSSLSRYPELLDLLAPASRKRRFIARVRARRNA